MMTDEEYRIHRRAGLHHMTTVGPGGCWLWTGWLMRDGYGVAGWRTTTIGAHRAAYLAFVGEIPADAEVDHLCRVRHCINPEHLEAVSRQENIRRRFADYAQCKNGHDFTEATTYIRPNGYRDCRPCIRERQRRCKARRETA